MHLLQVEVHGEVVLNAYSLTTLLTRCPFGHRLYYAYSLSTTATSNIAEYPYARDGSIFFNDECNIDASGNIVLAGKLWIFDILC